VNWMDFADGWVRIRVFPVQLSTRKWRIGLVSFSGIADVVPAVQIERLSC
jgi:hypothetical protein